MFVFPFHTVSNYDLQLELFRENTFKENIDIRNLLRTALSDSKIDNIQFNYYSPLQINSLFNANSKSVNLSIFHINIRSLSANHDKLVSVLTSCNFKFDLIILSEIWSSNISFYHNLFGKKYSFFYEGPSTSKAGGVGIFVKNEFNPVLRKDFLSAISNAKCFESVWIELDVNKTKYYIGGYYRHPNTPLAEFKECLVETLEKLKNKKRVTFFGDMNFCLKNYNCDFNTTNLVNEIHNFNFLPYSLLPTRITNHSATMIDHVYSNINFTDACYCKVGLLCSDISDHCGNFMFLCNKKSKPTSVERPLIRLFTKKNIDLFKASLNNTDFSEMYDCNNTDEACNIFFSKLSYNFNHVFKSVRASRKSMKNNKPWLTPAILTSINNKCKMYQKWITTKQDIDEKAYKNYSKTLRKIINKAEANYYSKMCNSRFQSIKKVWENLNKIVNFKFHKKGKSAVNKILVNNNYVITDPLEMATHFKHI